jgi:hypothetical protein
MNRTGSAGANRASWIGPTGNAVAAFGAFLLVFLTAPANLSCASGAPSAASTGRTTTAVEETPVATLRDGAPVRLAPGESTTVEPGAMRIRFDRVLEDSRCPSGVTCVWAGRARVQLTVRPNGSAAGKSYELEVGSPEQGVLKLGDLNIAAQALDPYPNGQIPTDPATYRLVLALVR